MTGVVASSIVSPLGWTVNENFQALLSGISVLKEYSDKWDLPEPFMASLFSDNQWKEILIDGYTEFESLSINSIKSAIRGIDIDFKSKRTALILSTTKGNIDKLGSNLEVLPGETAKKIANYFGLETSPIVACNACVSGLSAIILASRLIGAGEYDNIIVCGAEILSKFIVSGFQSLKACSKNECRPFDIERNGLNLGEAAATVILSNQITDNCYGILDACVSNDAFHLCTPSKSADGCYIAINNCLGHKKLSFIGVHGTATLYNDQMESMAIQRAGLSDVPLSAIKGYFGHTLGAAGVLETIIAIKCLETGMLPSNRGYSEIGVSGHINISSAAQDIKGDCCIKIISGFGGCNAAVRIEKLRASVDCRRENAPHSNCETVHKVMITNSILNVDGKDLPHKKLGDELITEIYKTYIDNYPKFYKMDKLSKLAFVASELIIKQGAEEGITDNSAVVLFNHTSSLLTDKKYFETIFDKENFLPSPSLFLYTLPNISTGEIAIRNNCHGETSFYILDHKSEELMSKILNATMDCQNTDCALTGWVDYDSENDFIAELQLIKKI